MIVLASASPRRQELLRGAGIQFSVQPAAIDETPRAGELPRSFAERMAREKALRVFKDRPQEWVLGADTIVVIDNAILGKPADETDAARMLRLLSGRTHEVITGVCVVAPKVEAKPASCGGQLGNTDNDVRSETTLVTMRKLSEKEITDYIATGEPMDKAGAYAIQGHAARWITRVEGDYNNVVGLPVNMVKQILAERKLL